MGITRPTDPSVFVPTGQLLRRHWPLGSAEERVSRAIQQFQERPWEALDAYRRAVDLGPTEAMTPEIRAVAQSLEAGRSA